MCPRVSPCVPVCRRVSPCVAMCPRVSPCVPVCHHTSYASPPVHLGGELVGGLHPAGPRLDRLRIEQKSSLDVHQHAPRNHRQHHRVL
eukprot:1479379-Pyramimonas_sp.AAC.1